jgi:CAAX prenyl protease-like protein
MGGFFSKYPSLPFVAPFAVFMMLLAAGDFLSLGVWEFPARVAVLSAVIWVCREALDFRVTHWMGSIAIGIGVFVLWVAPDLIAPGYRHSVFFENSVTGRVASSFPEAFHVSTVALVFRTVRAVLIVPIVEELFWRGWLMRWLIQPDFQKVALGAFQVSAFFITAALFASEHGPFWDVGFLAGVIYNAWMIRTRSLGDCIVAHAVTNGVLSGYVIAMGRWEYW